MVGRDEVSRPGAGDRVGRADTGTRRPHHYGPIPRIEVSAWRLTVSGETADGGVTSLRWQDMCALPRVTVEASILCAETGMGESTVWSGVPAAEIVNLAPPAPGADFALAYGAYGYASTVRVDDLLSAGALLATGRNGEALPPEHGGPVRLLLPHLYGWKSSKWLLEIRYCASRELGFWEERGYHPRGQIASGERYTHDG